MKLLVLDNYDSFTFNLVHLVESIEGVYVQVFRNDKISVRAALEFDKILLSPGPGLPSEAGIMPELIHAAKELRPVLGICLGHQAICEAFGGHLKNLDIPLHGIQTEIEIMNAKETLFTDLPPRFNGGHYHSWVADPEKLPDCLSITAKDSRGNIMGLSHKSLNVKGLQFHPESVLSEYGKQILGNWISS